MTHQHSDHTSSPLTVSDVVEFDGDERDEANDVDEPFDDLDEMTRITDGANDGTFVNGALGVLMLAGAAAILIGVGGRLNYDTESADFNPLGIFPPLLMVGGLVYLGIGARTALRHWRFGESVLEFTGPGPRTGDVFSGKILCSGERSPTGPYRLRLSFIETYRVREDGRPYDLDHARWEATEVVPALGVSTRLGVPFSFSIPDLQPRPMHPPNPFHIKSFLTFGWGRRRKVLSYNRPPDSVRWILEVDAPMPGINYHSAFGIAAERRYSTS